MLTRNIGLERHVVRTHATLDNSLEPRHVYGELIQACDIGLERRVVRTLDNSFERHIVSTMQTLDNSLERHRVK